MQPPDDWPRPEETTRHLEGRRIGPYQLGPRIGAGGMGEIYRARDTRLDRTVAIKVLPAHVAGDARARERFEREARAVAALNDPHICTLHDIGRDGGVDFLVMECLEGETLAARLEKGALPTAQAIHIGTQIASALDRAHRAGIVHRDLKPGNIFLVRGAGGQVTAKLLDFGLAKTVALAAAAHADASLTPTIPPDLTSPGTLVGTIQYMAPEQLEGRTVDARADIFAFGAVMYEMLAGRKPFTGESQAGVIAAILEHEPRSLADNPPHIPPRLARIVETCLAKDPGDRWQTARDLLRELTWMTDEDGGRTQAAPSDRRGRPFLWAAVGAGLAAAVVIAGTLVAPRPTPRLTPMQFQIATPPTGDPISFELSPDARYIAFVAVADGASKVFVRPLDRLAATALAGTEGAIFPFWSPDGRTLGFFADGKLKTIDTDGGSLRVLADAPNGRGGSWSRDGTILFAPSVAGAIMRIPATGGTPTAVTRLTTGQQSHRWPELLPDGRHFLFHATQGAHGTSGLFVGSLDGTDVIRVFEEDVLTTFVPPDRLIIARKDAVVAVGFDIARGAVRGEAVRVADAVGYDATWSRAALSASAAGVIAYRTGLTVPRRLVWFDRAGAELGSVGPTDDTAPSAPEISPDGRRAVVFRTVASNVDVWLIDLSRGVSTRFTFNDAVDFYPVWSPDGTHIVYASNRNGPFEFYEKDLTGTGGERLLPVPALTAKLPLAISPDGHFLLYGAQVPQTGVDLWALALTGDRKSVPILQTPFDEMDGTFSPDGRWIAYESNESGRVEIYVRSFPDASTAIQVSSAGGTQPRWRTDGKELYYVAPDARLMAVPIRSAATGRTLDVGAPTPLFVTHLATGMNVFPAVGTKPQYAVASDGRFLMNIAVEGGSIPPITIAVGWNSAFPR